MGMVKGLLWSTVLWAAAPPMPSAQCPRKRVDACGCHHVYGLRHCHPNRRSAHCELPASYEGPTVEASSAPVRL